jgi:hypothetical protein
LQQGLGTFELCRLPAARQLDNQALMPLLQAAVQRGSSIYCFFNLPATQNLSSNGMLQLLEAAVQHGRYGCMKELY